MPFVTEQILDGGLLASRLGLAAVLCVAGVAKLFDRDGSRRSMIDFGVPRQFATFFGGLLPVLEIIVASALVPLASAWFGGLGALFLLAVFTVGVAIKLRRGESTDCHCFGQLQSGPIGWSTLVRNLLLFALAALVVLSGREGLKLSAVSWLVELRTVEIVSLSLSVLGAGLLLATISYIRRLHKQMAKVLDTVGEMKRVIDEDYAPPVERNDATLPIDVIPVGAPAPGFSLASIRGKQVTLDDLLSHGKSVLLLFVSPNCGPCRVVLNSVRDWESDYGDQVTIALLSKGTVEQNEERVGGSGASHVLLQSDEEGVFEDYQAQWTPAAIIVATNGRTACRMVYGDEAIRELVEATYGADAGGSSVAGPGGRVPATKVGFSTMVVGDFAPPFALRSLDGDTVESNEILGRAVEDTLLLFWSPDCPFCVEMTDQIVRWEKTPPSGAPRLIIIASGREDGVRASLSGLRTLVLLDPAAVVASAFGSSVTPSAVLVDSSGTIASELATGALNVLALAGLPFVSVKSRLTPDFEIGSLSRR